MQQTQPKEENLVFLSHAFFFLLKHLKCAMLIGNTGVIFGNRLHDYDNFTFGKNLYIFSNTMDIENGMPI